MRYRVAFTKRLQSDGADSGMRPSAELDLNLSDGIVAEKEFVELLETDAQHSQEVMDEDDAFLGSAAPEVWEYDVVDKRADEFEEAIKNSDLVLEYDVVDVTVTTADEVPAGVLSNRGVYPPDGFREGLKDALDVTAAGSGKRSGDDGPAGMPTGDPSAGGLSLGDPVILNDAEGLTEGESGDIDDLNVTTANDPRLGLTNRGRQPAEDWAANTGPTQNPGRGVKGDHPLDTASTLSPEKRRKTPKTTARKAAKQSR
jgi:hypothetical protein